MQELIDILSGYSIDDAMIIEESDRQFKAIRKLYESMPDSPYFMPLVICNALMSYQLSGTGEAYWEEFSSYASSYGFPDKFDAEELILFFNDFLPFSRGNRRLINMKRIRLEKFRNLFIDIHGKEGFYYENLLSLQEMLSDKMNQKGDSKTIIFALKMFHYGARIHFGKFIQAPFEIGIPIDSRILKIMRHYGISEKDPQESWIMISKAVNIPCLHLDAILWMNCDELCRF